MQEITAKHDVPKNHKKVLELCSAEWNKLSQKDRAAWEEVARNDKLRFVREKAAYKGQWNIPKKRAKKPVGAPKVCHNKVKETLHCLKTTHNVYCFFSGQCLLSLPFRRVNVHK